MGNSASAKSKHPDGNTSTTRTDYFFANPPTEGYNQPKKLDVPEDSRTEDVPWPLHICRTYGNAANSDQGDIGLLEAGDDAKSSHDVKTDKPADFSSTATTPKPENECDCIDLNECFEETQQARKLFIPKSPLDFLNNSKRPLPGLEKPYGDIDILKNENGQMHVILEEVQKRMKELNTYEPTFIDIDKNDIENSEENTHLPSKLKLAVTRENLPGLPKPFRSFTQKNPSSEPNEAWPAFESLAIVRNYLPISIDSSNGIVIVYREGDFDTRTSTEMSTEGNSSSDSVSSSAESRAVISTSTLNKSDGDHDLENRQEEEKPKSEPELKSNGNTESYLPEAATKESERAFKGEQRNNVKKGGLRWIRKAQLDEPLNVFHSPKPQRETEDITPNTRFERNKPQILSMDKFRELNISEKVENLVNVFSRRSISIAESCDEEEESTLPYLYQGFLNVISDKIPLLRTTDLTKAEDMFDELSESHSEMVEQISENCENLDIAANIDEVHLEFDTKEYLLQAEKSLEFFQAVENVVQSAANERISSSINPKNIETCPKPIQNTTKKVSELKSKSEGHLASPCNVCCCCKDKWGNNLRSMSEDVTEMTVSIMEDQPSCSESSAEKTMTLKTGLAVSDVHEQSSSRTTSIEEKSEKGPTKERLSYEISTPIIVKNQSADIRKTKSECPSKADKPDEKLPPRHELESTSETLIQADTLADLTDWSPDNKDTSFDFNKPAKNKLMLNWINKSKHGKKKKKRHISDVEEIIMNEEEGFNSNSWSGSSNESTYSSTLLPIWTGHKQ